MTDSQIDVFVFLSRARETCIPLETVAQIDAEDIDTTVCAFFEAEEETFGVPVTSLDADSYTDIDAYRKLFAHLRADDPDLVHIHPNVTGSVVRVMATALGIPVVSTQHHPHDDFGVAKNVINGLTNWLNDVVVCPSSVTAGSFHAVESLLMTASGTEKLIIPNGVNLADLHEARGIDPPALPDGTLVGTASRLIPHKQVDELVRAAARLAETHPDLQFVVVGDGPEKEALERLAADLGVADRIHFLGFLPTRAAVHAVMDELDVFAFPTCSEGFGVAVAEAMALETAVVVNDIPILREVVGDAGRFVDATDTAEFAAAIGALADDPDQRRTLAERAAARIETQFSLEHTVTEYVDLYRRMVTHPEQPNSDDRAKNVHGQ